MSTGWGRVQRDLVKWFHDQPKDTKAGTVFLALTLRYHRESVFRALLRLEDANVVRRVYYEDGGLGVRRQREWRMVPERWEAEQRYRQAVAKALGILEAAPWLRR